MAAPGKVLTGLLAAFSVSAEALESGEPILVSAASFTPATAAEPAAAAAAPAAAAASTAAVTVADVPPIAVSAVSAAPAASAKCKAPDSTNADEASGNE